MEIIAGENFIWVFELKNNDNSALALASLSSAKVEIFNNDLFEFVAIAAKKIGTVFTSGVIAYDITFSGRFI